MSVSDLIFPEQAGTSNFSKILGDLKRSNLSITNRLRSIREDAVFVEEVTAAFGRPLVANERCGSWYIDPNLKAGSAYFKSTDGHTSQWKFSTRRLNLHLLPLISQNDGIIIVDSTRRGKSMPDSLSKTISIWCCVINRAIFPDRPEAHDLYVPPDVVSDSERSQMLSRMPSFVESFKQLNIDLPSLRTQIFKPVRPTWVTQESTSRTSSIVDSFKELDVDLSGFATQTIEPTHATGVNEEESTDLFTTNTNGKIFDSFHPIICCTSSRRITDGELSHSGYIQGAGDDTENWALGLTPPIFWAHVARLTSTPEADLPDLITSLVSQNDAARYASGGSSSTVRKLTPFLYVCPLPIPEQGEYTDSSWCKMALISSVTSPEVWGRSQTQMEVGIGKHKAASRNLRTALPHICSFVSQFLNKVEEEREGSTQKRVLIACDTGKDLSVGVALALLCWCFDDRDNVVKPGAEEKTVFSKSMIKVRLGRIMNAMPDANPNRATLQSVNSLLMDWRK